MVGMNDYDDAKTAWRLKTHLCQISVIVSDVIFLVMPHGSTKSNQKNVEEERRESSRESRINNQS